MENSQKESRRIALMAALLAGACVLGYYCQAILKTQIIFTHFYYIPIILSALWWKRKGMAVAVFLAGFLLLSNFLWGQTELLVNNCFRAAFFIAVAFIVAILADKIEEINGLLRRKESKYRTLIENIPQKIFVKDKNSTYISCNENYAKDLKIRPDEIAGKTDYDFYPGDLAEKYRADDKRIIATVKTEEFEEEYIQDGRKAVVHTVKTAVKDNNGKVIGVLGVFHDITARKQAEDALRASEEKFRVLVETTSDWIWEVDRNGVYTYVSPKIEFMLGYLPEEVVGKTLFDLMPPDEAQRIGKLFAAIAAERKPFANLENTNLHKNGRQVVMETSGVPILDKKGQLTGYRGIDRDITERKKAEEKIKEADEEWQKTFNSISDLIFLHDNDFTITKTNKAFDDAIKMKPENIIGKKCYELLHKTDKPWHCCPFEMTRKDGEAHVQEIEDPNIGIPLLVTTSPLFDDNGRLIGSVHIAKDISGIKQNEKKLKEVQAQLVQTSKLATLGEMSAGLAHEINQPLSGIALTAKKLRKLMEKGSLTQGDTEVILRDIDGSIERITRIIQHIRTFARQDTFNFTPVNVNETIEGALSLLNEQLRLHEIAVIKEYPDNLPRINGESYQLEQVIINIITNARDALDEKGRENIEGYSKKLVFKTAKIKDEVCVSISDNGIGMTDEVKGKMFQPFFTTKEVGKAMGLGMSTSFGIIASHKGRMEVESAKNAGTTIRVFLPIGMLADN